MASAAELAAAAAQAAAIENQHLALWISGIGVVSTLLGSVIVVGINSWVNLKAKRIDVQQKKDEQSYGFRMEYFKRKLTAGEKAISALTLQLKTLAQLRLNYIQSLNEIHYDAEVHKAKQERWTLIASKSIDSHFASDEIYFTYFEMESDFHDTDTALTRCVNAENDTILFIRKVNTLYEEYTQLEAGEEKEKQHRILQNMVSRLQEMTENYITLNTEAAKRTSSVCENIRLDLKKLTDKQ